MVIIVVIDACHFELQSIAHAQRNDLNKIMIISNVNQKSIHVKWAQIVAHHSPGKHFLYVITPGPAVAVAVTFLQFRSVVKKIEPKI